MWASFYNIPKAIFYGLKGGCTLEQQLTTAQQDENHTSTPQPLYSRYSSVPNSLMSIRFESMAEARATPEKIQNNTSKR